MIEMIQEDVPDTELVRLVLSEFLYDHDKTLEDNVKVASWKVAAAINLVMEQVGDGVTCASAATRRIVRDALGRVDAHSIARRVALAAQQRMARPLSVV